MTIAETASVASTSTRLHQNEKLLVAALRLAALGFSVHPLHGIEDGNCTCERGAVCGSVSGKHPRLGAWTEKATTDQQIIRGWWKRWPNSNVGIAVGLSGLVMVDLDSPEALTWASQHLPHTPVRVRSGRVGGGAHLYYRKPAGAVGNKAHITINGVKMAIDIRADNGNAVGPGSRHKSGSIYVGDGERWTSEAVASLPVFDPSWFPAPEPPAAQPSRISLLRAAPDALDRARAYLASVPPAVQGSGGDQHTFVMACKVVRGFGLSRGDAFSVLSEWNSRCSPPWSDQGLLSKIDGALKYGEEPMGHMLAEQRATVSPISNGRIAVPDAPSPPAPHHPQEASEWGPVVPLGQRAVPDFPVNALPQPLLRFVRDVSEAMQTPTDLAALMSIAVCGSAIAKKVEIWCPQGYAEACNLWALAVLPPGERKSPIMKEASAPLLEFEARQAMQLKNVIREAARKRTISEQRIKTLAEKAAKTDDDAERGRYVEQIRQLEAELPTVPVAPTLCVSDVTPERLTKLLADNGGRLAVLSAEGELIQIAGGRYSKDGAANIEALLKGFSGDDIRIDRVGQEPVLVHHPALTMGFCVQPDVLAGMTRRQEFKGRGFLGRFIYAVPNSRIGHRLVCPEPLGDEVRYSYAQLVQRLLDIIPDVGPDNKPRPHRLHLSAGAREIYLEFVAWCEARMRPGAELAEFKDWGGRLAGLTARLCGVLHVVAVTDRPWSTPVSEATVCSAIGIAQYAIHHAIAAYEMADESGRKTAHKILDWIREEKKRSFNLREAWLRVRSQSYPKSEDVAPVLKALEDHGFVRELEQPRPSSKGGRPPSAAYVVNPAALSAGEVKS
ncbi:MAG: DUF3987 domain-containing protein [Candidatus Xenobia bacterium]